MKTINNTTNNATLKELELDELEQVSGGCIWCLAALGSTAAVIAGIGYVYYLAHKKD